MRWNENSQIFLLEAWAYCNIQRLFEFIRNTETKTFLDIETMIGKMMSFAFSFGRMGLDFRSLILYEFTLIIAETFKKKINVAVKRFRFFKIL